jgi:hypothetical protein
MSYKVRVNIVSKVFDVPFEFLKTVNNIGLSGSHFSDLNSP